MTRKSVLYVVLCGSAIAFGWWYLQSCGRRNVGEQSWDVPGYMLAGSPLRINGSLGTFAEQHTMDEYTIPYGSVRRIEGKLFNPLVADSFLLGIYPDGDRRISAMECQFDPVRAKDDRVFFEMVDSLRRTYQRPFVLHKEVISDSYTTYSAFERLQDSGSVSIRIAISYEPPRSNSMFVIFSNQMGSGDR